MASDSAIGSLVQYLLQLIDKEVDLLVGVKDEVDSLQGHLKQINVFLDESGGGRNGEAGKEVVRQIREVAYKIEDVIDRYILIYSQYRRRNMALKTISIDYPIRVSGVGKKIKVLQTKIEDILHYGKALGTERADASVGPAAREEALHRRRTDVEVEDVVGFIDDSATLVSRLTTGNSELNVISIIGIGGLGKSTLARKIYDDASVQSHFNCRAWVCVSQDFRVKELLLEILTSHLPIWDRDELTRKIEGMCNDDLQNKYLKEQLVEHLEGKRYLVVMDDIWSPGVWDQVHRAFPENRKGSRILITSRIKAVALHASRTSDPYLLPLLNQDESWNLLSKKVFGRGGCPPELETPGRQMAECCRGLPLSIVELADILAEKEKSLMNWSRSVGKVNRHLKDCKDIIALSYTHLSRYLKLCFLYLGVYPKDYEIPVRQLIQLWIAEGFIPQADGGEMEDNAEDDYLENFIDQNLIQVVSRRTDGRKKTCLVPDLLRDICISLCKEEKFLEVFEDTNLSFPNQSRRLSLQVETPECISSKCARSLLFFGQDTYSSGSNHLNWAIKHLKLVRVLNFEQVKLYSIPTKIEKLVFLRYLRIKSLELKDLPASICNLENLETLDMRGSKFLTRLPKGIWKLRRLRNLYLYGAVSLPNHLDRNIRAMENLRVLSTISPNLEIVRRISSGEIFPNLTKFGIWFASSENHSELVDIIKCLHYLSHLRTLKIVNFSEYPILSSSFPVTITKITLRQGCLKLRRDMKVLGNLPSLQILKLQSCVLSRKLHIFAGSFPQLQVLKLEKLRIEIWKQRRRAMPYLRHLVIKECDSLTVLPQERRFTTLRDVEVLGCSTELVTMLQDMQTNLRFNLRTD
jgi:hypothetical protein